MRGRHRGDRAWGDRGCAENVPPSFLAAGAGIGLLSSVIPYWLELEALRRITTSLFGVWMSVQPAVAALIGLAFLGQRLSPAEWAGICCVAAASAGAAGNARAPGNQAGAAPQRGQAFPAGPGSRAADTAISVRDRAPNFARMRETCARTVSRDRDSPAAISGLDRPSAISLAIFASVGVSDSHP